MTTRKQLKKKFEARRKRDGKQLRVAFYIEAMRDASGLPVDEYTLFVGDVFSKFLIDLHFGNVADAVFAKDETASLRIFKKEMQRLLRENGIDENHSLLKQ